MNTETPTSFIPAAIVRISVQTSSFGKAAGLVAKQNEEHWANDVACAWADLVTERNQLRVLDLEDGGTRVRDMPVKPEIFLSLCQNLLNQSCWAARQYIRACEQNAIEESVRGSSGIDFSQDVAEEVGIEPIDVAFVEDALQEDLATMINLHSYLSKHMSYLQDIDDLHLFVERQQEGEVWRVTATADTFDEASDLMNTAVTRMAERADKEINQSAHVTDFTMDAVEQAAKEERGVTAAA